MTTRRYDALFLDFYGTVAGGDRLAVERVCRNVVGTYALPVTANAFAVLWGTRFFQAIEASNQNDFRTLHACELVSLRNTLRPLVGDVEPEPFVEDIEAYWSTPPVHPDAIELLGSLDLPVCCVSNADTAPLEAAIARHGLRFDHVISSESVRCYKPDAAIFEAACACVNVKPTRVMHVGDSLHSDVGGAGRLGITTTWVRRDDRIHDIGTASPDHTIRSLAELPDLL